MRFAIFYFIPFLLLVASCGAKKRTVLVSPSLTNNNPVPMVEANDAKATVTFDHETASNRIKQLIVNYNQWKDTVSTLHLKMNGNATIPKNIFIQNASVRLDINILKDTMIWLSVQSILLGKEVFRGIFERNRVTLISSFLQPNNMQMDYAQLAQNFGVSLSFPEIQEVFFLPIVERYQIEQTSDISNVNASFVYDMLSPSFQKTMSVQVPYNQISTFPARYKLGYKLDKDNSRFNLSVDGGMPVATDQFPQWLMNIQLFKEDARIFMLNQKSVSVDINQPFQNPSFD